MRAVCIDASRAFVRLIDFAITQTHTHKPLRSCFLLYHFLNAFFLFGTLLFFHWCAEWFSFECSKTYTLVRILFVLLFSFQSSVFVFQHVDLCFVFSINFFRFFFLSRFCVFFLLLLLVFCFFFVFFLILLQLLLYRLDECWQSMRCKA